MAAVLRSALTDDAATIDCTLLRATFDYDPLTGVLVWKRSPSRNVPAGSIAGNRDVEGYVTVQLDGCRYKAHRLVWVMVHGTWPRDSLDHINGDSSDNRIANLRECSTAENGQNRVRSRNNTSGFLGVSRLNGRWRAAIKLNGVRKHLGSFDTAQDAYAAYLAAKAEMHPFQQVPRALSDAELEAHIRSCGELFLKAHALGDMVAARHWMTSQALAVEALSQARIQHMETCYFAADGARARAAAQGRAPSA